MWRMRLEKLIVWDQTSTFKDGAKHCSRFKSYRCRASDCDKGKTVGKNTNFIFIEIQLQLRGSAGIALKTETEKLGLF